MTRTHWKLNIGYSFDEIYTFYGAPGVFQNEKEKLENEELWKASQLDRTGCLGAEKRNTRRLVNAFVFDWDSDGPWDKPKTEWEYENGYVKGTVKPWFGLELEKERCIPATSWPLFCFGYQFQDYFRSLKSRYPYLVAPGEYRDVAVPCSDRGCGNPNCIQKVPRFTAISNIYAPVVNWRYDEYFPRVLAITPY